MHARTHARTSTHTKGIFPSHTHLEPFPHLQEPLLKDRNYPTISSRPHIEQEVPITADGGDQLLDKLGGGVIVGQISCAVKAP